MADNKSFAERAVVTSKNGALMHLDRNLGVRNKLEYEILHKISEMLSSLQQNKSSPHKEFYRVPWSDPNN